MSVQICGGLLWHGKGKVTAEQAKAKAQAEYDIFNKTQKIQSDFDKELKNLLNKD